MTFAPPMFLTVAFVALTLALVTAELWLLRRAAPADQKQRWTTRGVGVAAAWLALHAGLALSGVLEGNRMPPPVMFFLLPTLLVGVALAFSSVGRALAALPLGLLVALQAFRLPLEMILHGLYDSGQLPVQMTWSGWNFDVVTGASAAVLGIVALKRPLPRTLVWAWNTMGMALLLIVTVLAITSAPTPLRRFMEDPPVLLPFHVPYNWIVGVHVWSALVGHLVIFRALVGHRHSVSNPAYAVA